MKSTKLKGVYEIDTQKGLQEIYDLITQKISNLSTTGVRLLETCWNTPKIGPFVPIQVEKIATTWDVPKTKVTTALDELIKMKYIEPSEFLEFFTITDYAPTFKQIDGMLQLNVTLKLKFTSEQN